MADEGDALSFGPPPPPPVATAAAAAVNPLLAVGNGAHGGDGVSRNLLAGSPKAARVGGGGAVGLGGFLDAMAQHSPAGSPRGSAPAPTAAPLGDLSPFPATPARRAPTATASARATPHPTHGGSPSFGGLGVSSFPAGHPAAPARTPNGARAPPPQRLLDVPPPLPRAVGRHGPAHDERSHSPTPSVGGSHLTRRSSSVPDSPQLTVPLANSQVYEDGVEGPSAFADNDPATRLFSETQPMASRGRVPAGPGPLAFPRPAHASSPRGAPAVRRMSGPRRALEKKAAAAPTPPPTAADMGKENKSVSHLIDDFMLSPMHLQAGGAGPRARGGSMASVLSVQTVSLPESPLGTELGGSTQRPAALNMDAVDGATTSSEPPRAAKAAAQKLRAGLKKARARSPKKENADGRGNVDVQFVSSEGFSSDTDSRSLTPKKPDASRKGGDIMDAARLMKVVEQALSKHLKGKVPRGVDAGLSLDASITEHMSRMSSMSQGVDCLRDWLQIAARCEANVERGVPANLVKEFLAYMKKLPPPVKAQGVRRGAKGAPSDPAAMQVNKVITDAFANTNLNLRELFARVAYRLRRMREDYAGGDEVSPGCSPVHAPAGGSRSGVSAADMLAHAAKANAKDAESGEMLLLGHLAHTVVLPIRLNRRLGEVYLHLMALASEHLDDLPEGWGFTVECESQQMRFGGAYDPAPGTTLPYISLKRYAHYPLHLLIVLAKYASHQGERQHQHVQVLLTKVIAYINVACAEAAYRYTLARSRDADDLLNRSIWGSLQQQGRGQDEEVLNGWVFDVPPPKHDVFVSSIFPNPKVLATSVPDDDAMRNLHMLIAKLTSRSEQHGLDGANSIAMSFASRFAPSQAPVSGTTGTAASPLGQSTATQAARKRLRSNTMPGGPRSTAGAGSENELGSATTGDPASGGPSAAATIRKQMFHGMRPSFFAVAALNSLKRADTQDSAAAEPSIEDPDTPFDEKTFRMCAKCGVWEGAQDEDDAQFRVRAGDSAEQCVDFPKSKHFYEGVAKCRPVLLVARLRLPLVMKTMLGVGQSDKRMTGIVVHDDEWVTQSGDAGSEQFVDIWDAAGKPDLYNCSQEVPTALGQVPLSATQWVRGTADARPRGMSRTGEQSADGMMHWWTTAPVLHFLLRCLKGPYEWLDVNIPKQYRPRDVRPGAKFWPSGYSPGTGRCVHQGSINSVPPEDQPVVDMIRYLILSGGVIRSVYSQDHFDDAGGRPQVLVANPGGIPHAARRTLKLPDGKRPEWYVNSFYDRCGMFTWSNCCMGLALLLQHAPAELQLVHQCQYLVYCPCPLTDLNRYFSDPGGASVLAQHRHMWKATRMGAELLIYDNGLSFLHWLCLSGDVAVTRWFIDRLERTPGSKDKVAEFLLRRTSKFGWTPVHYAVYTNAVETLELIFDTVKRVFGSEALQFIADAPAVPTNPIALATGSSSHLAAMAHNIIRDGRMDYHHRQVSTRMAWDSSFDPNCRDFVVKNLKAATAAGQRQDSHNDTKYGSFCMVGVTPLHIASLYCHMRCMSALLEAGANPVTKIPSEDIDAHDIAIALHARMPIQDDLRRRARIHTNRDEKREREQLENVLMKTIDRMNRVPQVQRKLRDIAMYYAFVEVLPHLVVFIATVLFVHLYYRQEGDNWLAVSSITERLAHEEFVHDANVSLQNLKDVAEMDEFYLWLDGTFKKELFPVNGTTLFLQFWTLLGSVRITQLRGERGQCGARNWYNPNWSNFSVVGGVEGYPEDFESFAHEAPNLACFTDTSHSELSRRLTSIHGPELFPMLSRHTGVQWYLLPERANPKLLGSDMEVQSIDIPSEPAAARAELERIVADDIYDAYTRAVVIWALAYNPSIDAFACITVLIEMSVEGMMYPTFEVSTVPGPLLDQSYLTAIGTLVFGVYFILYMLYFSVEEASDVFAVFRELAQRRGGNDGESDDDDDDGLDSMSDEAASPTTADPAAHKRQSNVAKRLRRHAQKRRMRRSFDGGGSAPTSPTSPASPSSGSDDGKDKGSEPASPASPTKGVTINVPAASEDKKTPLLSSMRSKRSGSRNAGDPSPTQASPHVPGKQGATTGQQATWGQALENEREQRERAYRRHGSAKPIRPFTTTWRSVKDTLKKFARYLGEDWNAIDLLGLTVMYWVVATHIILLLNINDARNDIDTHPPYTNEGVEKVHFYSAMFRLKDWLMQQNCLIAALLILQMVKLMKYAKLLPIIGPVINALVNTITTLNLWVFIAVWQFLTVAFTLGLNILLGEYLLQYKSFYDSFFTIQRHVLSDFDDFESFYTTHTRVGPTFWLAATYTCHLLLLNLFIAVISADYERSLSSATSDWSWTLVDVYKTRQLRLLDVESRMHGNGVWFSIGRATGIKFLIMKGFSLGELARERRRHHKAMHKHPRPDLKTLAPIRHVREWTLVWSRVLEENVAWAGSDSGMGGTQTTRVRPVLSEAGGDDAAPPPWDGEDAASVGGGLQRKGSHMSRATRDDASPPQSPVRHHSRRRASEIDASTRDRKRSTSMSSVAGGSAPRSGMAYVNF